MRRREFITLIGGAAAAWPLAARAQQTERVRRIGVLTMAGTLESALVRAFREELRHLGHVEGGTIALEFHSGGGDPVLVSNLAIKLVRSSVEVIVTDGIVASRAPKRPLPLFPL
jgi:putative tryptophan/tyrosine transport system substrate-binding protein